MSLHWDIFCDVVDNFGDAAICWRLSRQLAREHHQYVRIFTNNMAVLHLFSGTEPEKNISLHTWEEASHALPGDVVVESVSCTLPDPFIARMAVRLQPPLWINFEYLALESWADGCHSLPSPHPHLPLTKYFFFPGFGANTGGLLREHGLLAQRDAFLENKKAQHAFWHDHHLPEPADHCRLVSLFGYENPELSSLLDTFEKNQRPTWCIIPESRIVPDVTRWLGTALTRHVPATRKNLSLLLTDFLTQDAYDHLLWLCDLNCVRGEDSLIRALWAGSPFLWQAYPQKDNAQWDKVAGLVAHYGKNLPAAHKETWEAVLNRWNGENQSVVSWDKFIAFLPEMRDVTRQATANYAQIPDCTGQIMDFVNAKVRLTTPPV